eukprot:151101-Hanusia_phi.AAC.2
MPSLCSHWVYLVVCSDQKHTTHTKLITKKRVLVNRQFPRRLVHLDLFCWPRQISESPHSHMRRMLLCHRNDEKRAGSCHCSPKRLKAISTSGEDIEVELVPTETGSNDVVLLR